MIYPDYESEAPPQATAARKQSMNSPMLHKAASQLALNCKTRLSDDDKDSIFPTPSPLAAVKADLHKSLPKGLHLSTIPHQPKHPYDRSSSEGRLPLRKFSYLLYDHTRANSLDV